MKYKYAGREANPPPRTPLSTGCAACLSILMATSALAADPVDFDPALLLIEDAQDAPRLPTQTASKANTPLDAPLAPLEGDLADYLAEATGEWALAPGETLQGVLVRWADYAGWAIVWDASRDYPIQASLAFPRGTPFTEAVREVLKAVWRHNPTLKATVYKNKVVVITDAGAEGVQP